jgi:ribonuclease BN (tRNA processing enzyme)
MRHILLDCGEGTLFQLVRLVGPVQASAIISALDFVWLSHAHADHHLGLLEVARDFFRSTGRSLKVFAPTKLFHRRSDAGPQEAEVLVWLTLVSAMEGVPVEVSSCRELATTISDQASGASDSASAIRKHVPDCELLGVTAIRVEHRSEQFIYERCSSQPFLFELTCVAVATMHGPSGVRCQTVAMLCIGIFHPS